MVPNQEFLCSHSNNAIGILRQKHEESEYEIFVIP